MSTNFWFEIFKRRDLGVDGRIILKWKLRKQGERVWSALI
jgi:hypothetical protein